MGSFRTPAAAVLAGLALGAGTAHAAPAPITGLAPGPDFTPVPGFTPGPFAADGRGRVFVLAQDATSVVVYSIHGAVLARWSTGIPARPNADGSNGADKPARIAVNPVGDVYVLTRDERKLRRYTASGEFAETLGDPGDGGEVSLESPLELAVIPRGELVIGQNPGQLVIDADGRFLQRREAAVSADMTAGPDGKVWSAHPFHLLGRDVAGRIVTGMTYEATSAPTTGQVVQAGSLAVTPARELLSLDSGQFAPSLGPKRLQVFGPDGRLRAVCRISAQGERPELAVGSDGTVVVGDGPRIRSFRPRRGGTGCDRAPVTIAGFKIVRATRDVARIEVRVDANRRLARQGFRLAVAIVREEPASCASGTADPAGTCVSSSPFFPRRAGNVPRGRRTVSKTVALDPQLSPGKHRFHLSVQARGTGEVAATRGVPFTVR